MVDVVVVHPVGAARRLAQPEEGVAPQDARTARDHRPPPRLPERLRVAARVLVLVGTLEEERGPGGLHLAGAGRVLVRVGVLVDAVQGHRVPEARLFGRYAAEVIEVPVAGPGLQRPRFPDAVEDFPVACLALGPGRRGEVSSCEPEDVLPSLEPGPEVAAERSADRARVGGRGELLPPT